ncbi:MAG: dihydroorotase family protein [Firmicutes bacterium]|nr:dihydroorotase family protein [Bacillota bacterium]
MNIELLIQGCTAFLPEPLENASVGVSHGKIVCLSGLPTAVTAKHTISAQGLYLLPGLIDEHVHFRTPGLEQKEDYLHGSSAAMAGGITTILDMPNTNPATTTTKLLLNKELFVSDNSYVDYGFHFLLTKDNFSEILKLSPEKVASVKVFMAAHETTPYVVFNQAYLTEVAHILGAKGIPMTVHAEYQPLLAGDDQDVEISTEAARIAVIVMIEVARKTRCHVHILHVSTKIEVELLTQAKREGIPITFEVIPPHIHFSHEDFEAIGSLLRLRPSLKTKLDSAFLLEQLIEGKVDAIGSDHAPHTLEEKCRMLPPAGMPGTQEMLPVVYTELSERVGSRIACKIIATLVSLNPAALFQIKGKGRIETGRDADFVLFDPDAQSSITQKSILFKCQWSPYQGQKLRGAVKATFLRGEIIYTEGRIAGPPSGGPVYFER